jgi:hypothetical protein
MGRDGQGTEQPKHDVHVDETMAEADTHLVRLARTEAKQVVDSRDGWDNSHARIARGRSQHRLTG